ncbi:hypothetical protein RHGRI_003477 [Rhododendron griersonianum]|uniref:Uncharacterized protein n=1 Tax=Rhododendron griersonianum TaxID=479676 RepID=A0AAV6L8B4_9ERIC|nr:hypothetical protein RHGRI_003477 [Rhododendron griersonianum]
MPSTGSMPIKAEKFKVIGVAVLPRAREKAAFPPRLWPESAILLRFGQTLVGRTLLSPSENQFVTAAADLISSVVSGPATQYNCCNAKIISKTR